MCIAGFELSLLDEEGVCDGNDCVLAVLVLVLLLVLGPVCEILLRLELRSYFFFIIFKPKSLILSYILSSPLALTLLWLNVLYLSSRVCNF